MIKIKNSIKNISNIDDFYLQLKAVIPKTTSDNKYYFILLFEDDEQSSSRDEGKPSSSDAQSANINYKTDYLLNTNFNEPSKLNININDYLRKRKTTINITGEYTNEYIIDDYTIQDLLYYILDDNKLFYHNKFTNIYYTNDNIMISKHDNYYNSILFTKFFNLRDYIDDVFIQVNKIKRKYNKLNKTI